MTQTCLACDKFATELLSTNTVLWRDPRGCPTISETLFPVSKCLDGSQHAALLSKAYCNKAGKAVMHTIPIRPLKPGVCESGGVCEGKDVRCGRRIKDTTYHLFMGKLSCCLTSFHQCRGALFFSPRTDDVFPRLPMWLLSPWAPQSLALPCLHEKKVCERKTSSHKARCFSIES